MTRRPALSPAGPDGEDGNEVVVMLTYDNPIGEAALVELEVRPAGVVRGHVAREGIAAFLGAAFGEVLEVLAREGLAPSGAPFGRYEPVEDGFVVEVGFPATGPVTPSGRVVPGELPGGPAARVLHRGDYAGVAAAYETALAWVPAHGYVVTGPPWECYLDGPEVAEPRTEVYVPCRHA